MVLEPFTDHMSNARVPGIGQGVGNGAIDVLGQRRAASKEENRHCADEQGLPE